MVTKEKPQVVSLKLPPVLAGRLRALSRKKGKPQAKLLHEGLTLTPDAETRRGQGSVLDLIGDLIGSLEGPRDLGSNPKHLRGFGE